MANLNNYKKWNIVYQIFYSATYNAENPIKVSITESTNLNTPEKVLLSFFKKSIAILDETLSKVKQKYPDMV